MTKPSFSGPWMPWYHGDFLRATQGWTIAERCIYFMLLGASWEMGPLPDDRRRLAGIVGAQLDEFDQAWRIVQPKFDLTAAGLVNHRLEMHREKQQIKSEKAAHAADVSWENRRARARADANADAHGDAPGLLGDKLHESILELRTQNSGTQTTELKPARANARSVAAASLAFQEKIVEAYHELCPDLPRVKIWTPARRKSLDARIAERKGAGKPADTIDDWRDLFGKVAASNLLCGRDGGWRADLPWLLKPENFAKTIEGNYTNRTNGAHTHG
jgi:uncharacterized protein YdaU (DUF1376 family)